MFLCSFVAAQTHCYCCWCWIWSQTAKVLIGCIIYCFSLRRAATNFPSLHFHLAFSLLELPVSLKTENAFNICLSCVSLCGAVSPSKLLGLPKLLSSLIIPKKRTEQKNNNALQSAGV